MGMSRSIEDMVMAICFLLMALSIKGLLLMEKSRALGSLLQLMVRRLLDIGRLASISAPMKKTIKGRLT